MQEVGSSILPGSTTAPPSLPSPHVKQLWAPWRMTYVSGDQPASGGCLFCTVGAADDDLGNHVVHRGEHVFTILNRFPYSSGHVMVVPYRHVIDLGELDDAEALGLMRGASLAMAKLREVMGPDGFNVGLNAGTAAGGSIDHVHLHVVPRWNGDTNFMPVLGDVKVLPDHLERTAEQLRAAFARQS